MFFKSNKETYMYTPKVLGASAPAAAVLPATGSNRALFYTALVVLGAGVVTLVASTLVARKNR